jgi:hypothetical protein
MEEYKQRYNYLLQRYYNGCEYIKNNPETFEKYLPKVLNFLKKMNKILIENNITDSNKILNGF